MDRRPALIRLALFGLLVGAIVVVAIASGEVPSADEVREVGDDMGWAGPVLWVPFSAVLSSLFFPGPVLSGAAGALFGTALGTVVALAGAVASATLQMAISRNLAGDAAGAMLPKRAHRFDRFLERRGLLAVLYVRTLPSPFTALNYSAGLTRLPIRAMALGTAIAGAPKTWAYVAVGGNLSDLTTPEAKIAMGLLVFIWVVGAVIVGRELLARRRRGALEATG